MPVFMAGAVSLMLLYFPIPIIGNFITSAGNGTIALLLNLIFESTFGLASLYLIISVTYKYSSNRTRCFGIINLLSCITAIASYIALQGVKPEITEEAELKDNDHLSEAFEILHASHIKLAIDDFSTGYTSLVDLQSNKFDFVKLDGSLVRQLQKNERSIDIIKSIVDLGRSLDFDVIAEYVENEEIRMTLRDIGC